MSATTSRGRISAKCVLVAAAALFAAGAAQAIEVLPSGYTELEYIEADGNQYLDTGYTPTSLSMGFYVDFVFNNTVGTSGTAAILGSSVFNGGNWGGLIVASWTTKTRGQMTFGSDFYDPGLVTGVRIQAELKNKHYTTASEQESSYVAESFNISATRTDRFYGSIYLFARHSDEDSVKGKMRGRIYRFKVYEGETVVRDFVPAENAQGEIGMIDIVGDAGFRSSGTATAFIAGPVVATEYISVSGTPLLYGTPSPDYGTQTDLALGTAYTFTCPVAATNDAETIAAKCAGYTLALTNGEVYAGTALSTSIVYSSETACSRLTWLWEEKFKATVVTRCDGEEATAASVWSDLSGKVTVTAPASPKAGFVFAHWEGDCIPVGSKTLPSMTLSLSSPSTATAVYLPVRYVSPTGDNDASGLDADHPWATLQFAIDSFGGGAGVVRAAEGTYSIGSQLKLTNGVQIVATGRRDETKIRATAMGFMPVYINNADAVLKGFNLGGTRVQLGQGYRGMVLRIDTNGGTLDSCRVTGATQTDGGYWGTGAVAVRGAKGVVTRCIIDNNSCTRDEASGGGVWLSAGLLTDSLIYGNTALVGGGVAIRGNDVTVRNCTIAGNTAKGQSSFGVSCGGGIFVGHKNEGNPNTGVKIVNCVIAGNSVPEAYQTSVGSPEWGYPTVNYTTAAKLTTVSNMFENCCFGGVWPIGKNVVDAPAAYKDAANGDWSLRSDSACIDAGTDLYGLSATDVTNAVRVSGAAVDLGAYEYDLSKMTGDFAVDNEKPRAGDTLTLTATVKGGDSATHRMRYDWYFTEPRGGTYDFSVLDAENPLVRTFPAAGRYTVRLVATDTEDATVDPVDVTRTDFLRIAALTNYVVAASTPGAGDGSWPYDSVANATTNLQAVIDCALGGETILLLPGTHVIHQTLKVTNAVTLVGRDGRDATVVKGASNSLRLLHVDNRAATVRGITLTGISKGSCSGQGGDGCGYVGGVFGDGGTVEDCAIVSNKCTGGNWPQGCFALRSKRALMRRCLVHANDASSSGVNGEFSGGGVLVVAGTIESSVVTGNKSAGGGGGVGICGYNGIGAGTIRNCTIVGNYGKANYGGGVEFGNANVGYHFDSNCRIVNCIVSGNTSGNKTAVNQQWGSRASSASQWKAITNACSYCLFPEGATLGESSVTGEPVFRKVKSSVYETNWRLRPSSPGFKAGLYDATWMATGVDFYGEKRVKRYKKDVGFVDIGAAEAEPAGGTLIVVQ